MEEITIEELYNFYCQYTKNSTIYVVLSEQVFMEKLVTNKLVSICIENNQITGFASGVIDGTKGYISIVYGEHKIDLINDLEMQFKTHDITEVLIHFFNPVSLPWYPLKDIVHPCYQGVILDSEMHDMYLELGYQEHSIQDTYYHDLEGYSNHYPVHPDSHISFVYYDASLHKGLFSFAEEINAPLWKKVIFENQEKATPLPLLVAMDQDKVIGFTGPLKVTEDNRGFFAGIGVLERYRGRKIGTYLFHKLCESLQEMNARYMTLYTGRNNPAKNIYMGAGFTVVTSFVTLKKSVKE
ncbi:MAG: GNAT family N-acetyltransferase [Firmicutes bacterium]|nr:GNAT family N-acetyltransferase [Bacillota bacterium]